MDSPRKILILHASAGHGHEKAAKAVEEAYHVFFPQIEVTVIDALSLTPSFFGGGYKKSYLFLIQKLPWLWGIFYYFFDLAFVHALVKPIRRIVNQLAAQDMETLVLRLRPQAIICTHFLPVEVVSALKAKNKTDAYLVVAITDFKAHRFWLGEAVDCYAVPSVETRDQMVGCGVSAEKIEVTGIPVGQNFTRRTGREKLRGELGLQKDKFTVLVTSGGAGVGSICQMVRGLAQIKPPLQTLVVCGTNKSIRLRLESEFHGVSTVRLFGFVDFMDKLMEASDVLMGKGGGLTVSESLCKGTPMVVFEPVPGQETANAFYIQRHGAGVIAENWREAVRETQGISKNAAALARLKEAVASIAKPGAARQVTELAERGRE